ncbi:MAG: DUF3576 domain-containing protein [Kiloniellales bacterium]
MTTVRRRILNMSRCLLGGATLLLAACSVPDLGGDASEEVYPQDPRRYGGVMGRPATTADRESIFGEDGLVLFGEGEDQASTAAVGVGVNSFLWRGSLDTISFMPLSSADPFGGVIITDWYSPPETPDQRFKVNLYILGQQLRADGVRAAVFHQRRDAAGNWIDAPVEPKTATDLENAILTRARQLRISSIQ